MIRGRNRQASPETRRIRHVADITLRLGDDQQVLAKTHDVSPGGIFVVSSSPGPAGLTAAFELRILPDWKPITGEARVVWSRAVSESTDRPAGMALRITDIDDRGRRLLRWLVAHDLRTGGPPSGREPKLGKGDSTPETPSITRDDVAFPAFISASRPATLPARSSSRLGRIAAAVTVAGLTLAVGLWWGQRSGSGGSGVGDSAASTGAVSSSGDGPGSDPTTVAGRAAAEPAASGLAIPHGGIAEDGAEAREGAEARNSAVRAAVLAWASAWEEQRVADYLAAYASSFSPEDGSSRGAWEELRSERLTAPAFIDLTIGEIRIEPTPQGGLRTSFRQAYRSDTYADEVDKVLVWAEEGGRWRIVAERSNGG